MPSASLPSGSSPGIRRIPWRLVAILASAVALLASGVAFWALRQLEDSPVGVEVRGPTAQAVEPVADRLVLVPASFAELPGWESDRVSEALTAFVASCKGRTKGSDDNPLVAELAQAGSKIREICERAQALHPADEAGTRTLLIESFLPFLVSNNSSAEGLFTGYYEPELRGSRRKKAPYVHALYLAPRDQQVVDLGDFRKELAGRKVTGIVRDGRFRPYWDRAEIERGALKSRRLEFLWVDDAVALFFLQIQGSGRVVLPDGELVRVGYAGQNGHDYTAIGRTLIERGELDRATVSLQTIRAWLLAHPGAAAEVMNQNRSYVFFRVLPGAPVGSSGVELTPGRSLAIDPSFLPYGMPLWLDTTYPDLGGGEEEGAAAESPSGDVVRPLQRLVIGQDRGGAIRGPVRGDLFWGAGAEAEAYAGHMKQQGRLWILWPKALPPPASTLP